MAVTSVIRLEREGPAGTGLSRLELDPADFQSELPEQSWHLYYTDEALGLMVGVWTTTSMQEAFGPYPGDEFMYLLEGTVKLVEDTGNETVIRPGETFAVKNGIPVSWKQEGKCRKFFMLYLPPDLPAPELRSADGGICILREELLEAELTHEKPVDSGSPVKQKDAIALTNDAGNFSAGMWESDAFESELAPFPWHELAQLLDGEVTITDSSGLAQTFVPGDVFFIPKGTLCSWKADVPIRKFYCMLELEEDAQSAKTNA